MKHVSIDVCSCLANALSATTIHCHTYRCIWSAIFEGVSFVYLYSGHRRELVAGNKRWLEIHWYICMSVLLLPVSACLQLSYAVKSFVKLVRYLFSLPGVPPSWVFPHLLLELPSHSRPSGDFFWSPATKRDGQWEPKRCPVFRALRVVQACRVSVQGNCRGNEDGDSCAMDTKENRPLPCTPGQKKPTIVIHIYSYEVMVYYT